MRYLSLLLIVSICSIAGAETKPSATRATTQAQKLWLQDLPAYQRAHPGAWGVVRSVHPSLTPGEARQDACREAARRYATFVRQSQSKDDQAMFERAIEEAIVAGALIQDEEITANERPYGTLYYASLLLNISQQPMKELGQQLQRRLSAQHARRATSVVMSAGLVLLISCLYLIANAMTRGFFRFRLALASILLLGGGIFGIVHLL
ncbi:MAG TPA: hypothetical protein VF669_22820 [Tepidisphaeraceae bacterium]|jgi:phosphoribosyl-ATP pyrophosphohydrolase